MPELTPLHLWCLSAVALFLKIVLTASVQGYVRISNRAFVKPEDAAAFGKGRAPLQQELPLVAQAQNALRNDGENLPYFLAVSWAYVQLDCWHTGALIYFSLYVLTRYLHTALMLWPRQPWRTLTYATGLTIIMVMSAHILAAIFF